MAGLHYFNGIDGTTGRYLARPESSSEMQVRVRDPGPFRKRRFPTGADRWNLGEAGWGVLLSEDCPPAVREALQPLLRRRKEQAGERYREFVHPAGASPRAFYQRNGVGPGPVDPTILPYYLLLVGEPEATPFRLQEQLAVSFAAGRVCFATAEEYARYAESVVAAEAVETADEEERRAVVFACSHDPATKASADLLASPVARRLSEHASAWRVDTVLGAAATRSCLLDHLGGGSTPSFLFTASHGVGFPTDDPSQEKLQGALLCQDWPGTEGALRRDHYLAGEDVADDARPGGLVSFHLASLGAGTASRFFAPRAAARPRSLVSPPRIAALAQRLLGHPRGGSLAFVGLVDRSWGVSDLWDRGPLLETLVSAFTEMLHGLPVGAAMELLSGRACELAGQLLAALQDDTSGRALSPRDLVSRWIATEDARAYLVLGDPAVRVRGGG